MINQVYILICPRLLGWNSAYGGGGEPLLVRTIILSKTLAVLPGRLGRIRGNFIAIVAPNSSIEAPRRVICFL